MSTQPFGKIFLTLGVACVNKFSMSVPFTKPFKGMIFNSSSIGDISTCVCPPYDVISNAKTYFQRNKFNAIRLELPVQRPTLNKYDTAKETLEKWLQNRILVPDTRETIYIYEQEFEVDGKILSQARVHSPE